MRREPTGFRESGGGRGLRRGDSAALVVYSAVRMAADVCQSTAVAWLLARATDSPGVLGLASAAGLLPWMLLPLSGAVADRWPRRRIVAVMDGAAAVLAGLLALQTGRSLAMWAALAWTAAYALLSMAARPATKGISRELRVQGEAAARLSGALTAVEYSVLGAGQALAALLLMRGHAAPAFAATGILLAVGAAAISAAVPQSPPSPGLSSASPPPPAPDERAGIWATLRLLRHPALRGPFLATIVCGTWAFTLKVVAPLIALRHLHAGVGVYAALTAAYSLGAAGGSAAARWRRHWHSGTTGVAVAWLLAAPALAVAGASGGTAVVIVAFAWLGAAVGFQDAGNAARIAAMVPPRRQSQAMAWGSVIWRIPGLIAAGVAGVGTVVPLPLLCATAGGAQAVGAAAMWIAAHREQARAGDPGAEPRPPAPPFAPGP